MDGDQNQQNSSVYLKHDSRIYKPLQSIIFSHALKLNFVLQNLWTFFPNCRSFMTIAFGAYMKVKKNRRTSQPVFTCSKLTIETLEQGVKYVQS